MINSYQNYLLRLPVFDYLVPETIDEACRLLSEYKGQAKIVAGGTDLLVSMKQNTINPACLINIKSIPELDYIQYSREQGLRIGALTTLESITTSPVIREGFGLLQTACSKIGTPQVRNMGTIGGNICNGGPSQDSASPLLVLGAKLKIVSLGRERIVPVEEFFISPFQTVLDQTELLTEIQIPIPPPGSVGCYKWLCKRNEIDETLVGVSVLMMTNSKGDVCREIKIGLSSVAPVPIRATQAEHVLNGKTIDGKTIEMAAMIAGKETRPRSRAEYRRRMTSVLVERAILEVWEKIKQPSVRK